MRLVQRGAALVLAVALFSVSRLALAADEEQPIRIQYDAHPGCPDALQFFWHVRARTARLRLAEPGELATLVTVKITDDGGSSVGSLDLPRLDGEPFTRRVQAVTCEEVVVALSLVLALAYDPDASTALPTEPPPPAAPVAPPAIAPIAPAPPPLAPPSIPRVAAGMDVRFMGGIAPTLRPVLSPFVAVGANTDALFSPRVEVALLMETPTADISVVNGATRRSAALAFLGGQLTGCPVSVLVGSRVLELRPCLGLELGELFGTGGSDVSPSKSGSLTWAALNLSGEALWNVAGPLFVEMQGGGGLSLSRGRFVLSAPDGLVHRIPAVFGEFGLGIGVHFP